MDEKKREKLRREFEAFIEREKHAHRMALAALEDRTLMKQLVESYLDQAAGEQGEPWAEVKARLGLV